MSTEACFPVNNAFTVNTSYVQHARDHVPNGRGRLLNVLIREHLTVARDEWGTAEGSKQGKWEKGLFKLIYKAEASPRSSGLLSSSTQILLCSQCWQVSRGRSHSEGSYAFPSPWHLHKQNYLAVKFNKCLEYLLWALKPWFSFSRGSVSGGWGGVLPCWL